MTGLTALLADRNRVLALGLSLGLVLTYTFLNLHSAWEPTKRLTQIRAGLVNEDQSVQSDGDRVAIGEELARTLLEAKTFGWRELSLAEAERRIQSAEIDFFLHIPSDASARVVKLPVADKPDQAILSIYTNPAYNYPMNPVANALASTLRHELNGKISATYIDRLLAGLEGAVGGITEAASGARQIADGTQAAGAGAGQIATGLDQVVVGAGELNAGIAKVSDGAALLAGGAALVRDGNRELANGLVLAEAGARELSAGGYQVHDGTRRLVDGYRQIARGNTQLGDGLAEASDGARQIRYGVEESLVKPDPELAAASAAIEQAMKNLTVRRPALLLDRDYRALMAALQQLGKRADQMQLEGVIALSQALRLLELGLQQAEAGSRELATGAQSAYQQGQELVAGTARLAGGAGELAAGIERAGDGARALASGSGQLSAGATELANGTQQLLTGGRALASGLGQLRTGSHTLSDGLVQLTGGTAQLADGLDGATKGAQPPPRANAPAMSQPVQVVDQQVTEMPSPGEALLGLVLPIALWIGAIALVGLCQVTRVDWGLGETARERLHSMALPGSVVAGGLGLLCLMMGPTVKHPLLFVLFLALVTFAFIAMNQMLLYTLGRWGYVASVGLLILMPVVVGTRAPFILLPRLYQYIAPLTPLAHAIRGLQSTVAGGAWDVFWVSLIALVAFTLLSLWISGKTKPQPTGA